MANIVKSRISEIVTLHNKIEKQLRTSLSEAIRIGELLEEQKADLQHGQWESWLTENMPFTVRTATRYRNIYNNRKEIENGHVSDLTLTGAYKLISPPKPKVKIFPDCDMTFMDIKDIEPNPFFKMSRLIGEEVEYWVNVIEQYQDWQKKGMWEYQIPYWGTAVSFTGKEYQNICEHERFFAMKKLKLKNLWVCILEGERMLSDKRMKEVLKTFDYPRFEKYEAYRKELWKSEIED